MQNCYTDLNTALRERFGRKVWKLSLSSGCTCPNRDGSKGTGGCAFCAGADEFTDPGLPISEQIARQKRRIAAKLSPDAAFIAYFQSFTNTYAPVETLRPLFSEALEDEAVVALSVATRPDCLSDEMIAMLASFSKPVWVELGLQTSKEETAQRMNRCFSNDCFADSVSRLRAAGIEVIVHLIFGLPEETDEEMLDSVRYVCRFDIQGIKLHLLHLLRGTPLASKNVATLTQEHYYELIGRALPLIPRRIVIHRLTGDGDKRKLLSPLWSADKHRVYNGLIRYLVSRGIRQGSETEEN